MRSEQVTGNTPQLNAVAEIVSTAVWRPTVNPWIIAVSVMAATFMEVLDTSVANVALPHMFLFLITASSAIGLVPALLVVSFFRRRFRDVDRMA